MPEGPSIVILKEEAKSFNHQKVLEVSGNARIDLTRMKDQKIEDIRSWGKHFLLCFRGFTVRIHFLLFGSYRINEKKDAAPRLHLQFKKGELNFYSCSVQIIEGDIGEVYDWTADVMNDLWDASAARKKLKQQPDMLVCDALLSQDIFAGVGNIIKNEVLYRIKVHPKSTVGKLPPARLKAMIDEARIYSFDFLRWKKEFTLKAHWLVHTKKTCMRCDLPIKKEYLGKTNRRTFFCDNCQVKY